MTMQTIYFKEHEGIAHNPTGQLSSPAAVPWWSGLGSQSVYGESFGHLKSLSAENPAKGDQFTAIKQVELSAEHGTEKGNTTQFTIFAGISSIMIIYAILAEYLSFYYVFRAIIENSEVCLRVDIGSD